VRPFGKTGLVWGYKHGDAIRMVDIVMKGRKAEEEEGERDRVS
jgi:hypothetical protein